MDTQQQQAANAIAGLGAGIILIGVLIALAVVAFLTYLYWRIFTKAGMPGPLALIGIIPYVGWIVLPCILAFGEWKVVPAPQQGYLPPQYPPPPPAPSFPSTNYPQPPTS